MRYLTLFLALYVASPVYAESDAESVHFAAHFGLSYALTTVTYGMTHKAFRFDQTDALIFSAVLVFTAGMFRQVIEATDTRSPVNTRGIWQNAAGIGAAAATTIVFDF